MQVVFLLQYLLKNEELVEKAVEAIFEWAQTSSAFPVSLFECTLIALAAAGRHAFYCAVLFREELISHSTHKLVIAAMQANQENSFVLARGAAALFEMAKNGMCNDMPAVHAMIHTKSIYGALSVAVGFVMLSWCFT